MFTPGVEELLELYHFQMIISLQISIYEMIIWRTHTSTLHMESAKVYAYVGRGGREVLVIQMKRAKVNKRRALHFFAFGLSMAADTSLL